MTTYTAANNVIVIQWCNKRQPIVRRSAVANITLICCIRMVSRFAAGDDIVVTACTGTKDLGVVHAGCSYRSPGSREGLMTGAAHVTTVNMITDLSTGGYTVMASNTFSRRKC